MKACNSNIWCSTEGAHRNNTGKKGITQMLKISSVLWEAMIINATFSIAFESATDHFLSKNIVMHNFFVKAITPECRIQIGVTPKHTPSGSVLQA